MSRPDNAPSTPSTPDSTGTAQRRRTVVLAAPRSFCAGVERAIDAVERLLDASDRSGPVYVRKQVVHNTRVVAGLAARGAVFVEELDEVPVGATVVFSAHGVSPRVHAQAAARQLTVVDATCPLVAKVHSEARRFAARGDTIVLIGHAGHEEVEGTLGEAPAATVLVENAAQAAALQVPDEARVSYLTQTTLAVDETSEIVEALRRRFPCSRNHPPTTSATPPATGNWRSLRSPSAATWSWWSVRRTPRTRCGWWKSRAAPVPRPISSRTRTASIRPGSRPPAPSVCPPAPPHHLLSSPR